MVVDTLSYHCPSVQSPCPGLVDTNRGASGAVAKLSSRAIVMTKVFLSKEWIQNIKSVHTDILCLALKVVFMQGRLFF